MTTVSSGGSLIGKIGSYLQIVAKDPSSTAFVPLAEAYRQIGLLDDALEAARLGTKMLPHFSPGFSTMGRILGQMGRLDEAMSAYARALSIDRQSQSALVGLARLHLIRAERDLARKILKQAKEFHPDDDKITDMLIALDLPRPWAEIKQASKSKAAAVLPEDIVPVAPIAPIPTATLAEIYVKQGLLDEAVKVYEDILKQNPANEAARERVLQLKGQPAIKADSPVDAQAREGTASVAAEEVAAKERTPIMAAPAKIQSPRKDRSPLAVFQRWLTAITEGRTHVQ